MSQIQIRAEVDRQDINICRFTVDRPVYAGSVVYNSRQEASGERLGEALFAFDSISRVEVSDNIVTITKKSEEDWRILGRKIGMSIRGYLDPSSIVPEELLKEKIREIIDNKINPDVAAHGGYIELVDVKPNAVYIRMRGGCHGCGAADATLKMGIERAIREHYPQIVEVLDVTDHDTGANPYYKR